MGTVAHASRLEDEALKAQEQEKSEREAQAHKDAKVRQKAHEERLISDNKFDRFIFLTWSVILIVGAIFFISEIA